MTKSKKLKMWMLVCKIKSRLWHFLIKTEEKIYTISTHLAVNFCKEIRIITIGMMMASITSIGK